MGVKFHLCLSLIVLGITAYALENPELPPCNWPPNLCAYIDDPCPPEWNDCREEYYCPLSTNRCCCPPSG
ncbi:small cysteine-rich protein 5-like isoform X2 [Oculina patagonica]